MVDLTKTEQDEGRGQPEPGKQPTPSEVDAEELRRQLNEILGSNNLPGCGTGS